mmetsp:Transcript_63926/g.105507  ORF Transcript_63926/g.105507 Transcript_63926/m.105507 type:complete len:253 (-) Transcript_63926:488-1246(-)
MRSDHKLEAVGFQELLRHVWTKGNPNTTFIGMPASDWRGVGPQHLTHQPFVGNVSVAVDLANIVQRDSVLAKQPAVNTEHSIINDVAQWEPIENLREQCKAFLVQFVLDFAFKTVHFVQIPALVVSSAHEEVVGQQDLPTQQHQNTLQTEGASVHEVAVEKVWILLTGKPIEVFKDIHQIIILPVDVSTNSNGLVIRHRNVHQRGERSECFPGFQHDFDGILLVKGFLFLQMAHQLQDELLRDVSLQPRPSV